MKKSMIITMMSLILCHCGSPGTFVGSLPSFSEKKSRDHGSKCTTPALAASVISESSARISETSSGSQKTEATAIWPFKPKYNQNRIQRKNTPAKKNRRNKTLLRKWGLGMMEMEVQHG